MKETPLKIASGFVSNKKENEIFVSNWSDEAMQIKKGALLGYANVNVYDIMTLEEVQELENNEDDDKIYLENTKNSYLKKDFIEDLNELLEKNNKNMNPNEKERLIKFLERWKILFAVDSKNPGTTTKTKCFANTNPNTPPIRCQPYRCSLKAQDELKKQVEEMLKNKIIQKSNSPWAFPVVLAIKSDGTWRFCVDYSKLNQNTIKDNFPIPNVEDYLDRLQDAQIFTVLDFASGFWQIPINEDDEEKFSFITSLELTFSPVCLLVLLMHLQFFKSKH